MHGKLGAIAGQPATDLFWFATRQFLRPIQDLLHSSPSASECRLVQGLFGQLSLVSPFPEASDALKGAFRVFGAGPYDFRKTRPSSHPQRFPSLDWDLDPINATHWSSGSQSGGDIKVPWELGRLHFLPLLALSWDPLDPHDRSAALIEHYVADFVEENPSGSGVHWASSLEVAIRSLNLLLAIELLGAKGHPLDDAWARKAASALLDHGRFIERRLSWVPRGRNNHYLGEIMGLIALGVLLGPSDLTDAWLCYGYQEMIHEVRYQFLPDGGCFEGSTAYHGFGAEIVLWSSLLIQFAFASGRRIGATSRLRPFGAPRLASRSVQRWDRLSKEGANSPFPQDYIDRLDDMARFLEALCMPDGRLPQIGDNDSGRVTKLGVPRISLEDEFGATGDERLLDYQGIATALLSVGRGIELASDQLPADVLRTLGAQGAGAVGAHRHRGERLISAATRGTNIALKGDWSKRREYRYELVVPRVVEGGNTLLDGMEHHWFQAFGVIVFRSSRVYLCFRVPNHRYLHPRGGHMHADELSLELMIDGLPVVRDPGTGVYLADPNVRDWFRGRSSHWTPLPDAPLPGGRIGLFTAPRLARVEVLDVRHGYARARAEMDSWSFEREVRIGPDSVSVTDSGTCEWEPKSGSEWMAFFSPRYGAYGEIDRG